MPLTLDEVLQSAAESLFPLEVGEKQVTVESRDSEGDTPLHVMAWRKDVESAHILLLGGADVNAIGDMDQTPLHVAIMQGDIEMVKLLLKAGAITSVRSSFGKTAFEEAASKGGAIWQLFNKP